MQPKWGASPWLSRDGDTELDPLPGTQGNKAQPGQLSHLPLPAPCLHPALTSRARLSWCQLMLPAAASAARCQAGSGIPCGGGTGMRRLCHPAASAAGAGLGTLPLAGAG